MPINYKEQTGLIIDISVPRDENIREKELEKIDKYQSLKIELEQLWKVKIMVIPVDVGVLGAMTDRLPGWLQKSALLGTAQVLRRVLRLLLPLLLATTTEYYLLLLLATTTEYYLLLLTTTTINSSFDVMTCVSIQSLKQADANWHLPIYLQSKQYN